MSALFESEYRWLGVFALVFLLLTVVLLWIWITLEKRATYSKGKIMLIFGSMLSIFLSGALIVEIDRRERKIHHARVAKETIQAIEVALEAGRPEIALDAIVEARKIDRAAQSDELRQLVTIRKRIMSELTSLKRESNLRSRTRPPD